MPTVVSLAMRSSFIVRRKRVYATAPCTSSRQAPLLKSFAGEELNLAPVLAHPRTRPCRVRGCSGPRWQACQCPQSDSAQPKLLHVAAQCSPAVENMHAEHFSEETNRQPGPDAASAGCAGACQEPSLLQLDQDALDRVFAELEPEALAIAGSRLVCTAVLERARLSLPGCFQRRLMGHCKLT